MAAAGSHRGESGRRGSPRSHPAGASNGERRGPSKLAFTIPSRFDAGQKVQQQILADVQRAGFDEHSFFAVKLALEEALVNAIKHGNRLDPGKTVVITATVSPQRVEICIEDQGSGFDRAHVPDPTCDENLEKCSGRGILLIESYMNRVHWDRGGRRLTMSKDNVQ